MVIFVIFMWYWDRITKNKQWAQHHDKNNRYQHQLFHSEIRKSKRKYFFQFIHCPHLAWADFMIKVKQIAHSTVILENIPQLYFYSDQHAFWTTQILLWKVIKTRWFWNFGLDDLKTSAASKYAQWILF